MAHTAPAGPWRLAPVLLLALALLAPRGLAAPGSPRAADEPDSPASLLGAVSAALREEHAAALVALVDFPAHSAEGRLRGSVLHDWERLDAAAQQAYREELIETWLDDDPGFLRNCRVYDYFLVDDPDAGLGPVPDRYLIKVVLKASARGQLRDLILIATPEHRLLDLEFGVAYTQGQNPLGEAGLRPRSFALPVDAVLRWPTDIFDYEREAARELVRELVRSEAGGQRERLVEYLHRSPYAGVTALLERLMAVDRDTPEDANAARVLVATLEIISGRHGGLPDEGEPLTGERLRAETLSWLRWHDRQGLEFDPAPILEPIERTFEERGKDEFPARGSSAADTDRDAPATDPGQPVDAATPTSAGERPSPQVPATPPPPPSVGAPGTPGTPPGADEAGSDDEPDLPKPTVRFHKPKPVDLGDASALTGFEVLLVPPNADDARSLPVGEALDQLPDGVLDELDRWAGLVGDLGARVAFGGDPEFLVIGRGEDGSLISAVETLRLARAEIGGLLPPAPGDTLRPVVVLLADQEFLNGSRWSLLLDGLVARRLLDSDAAEGLRYDRGGFSNRTEGFFVQPTFDLAGNAAAGDDEFRQDNELAHKLAAGLAVRRFGFLPTGLLWALGHVAEQRLFGTTYQFNKTGFVSTGDHFDWPGQAGRVLQKAAKSRRFDLAEEILRSGQASDSIDRHLVAWSALEYLAGKRPTDLSALILDLQELHQVARPYGGASGYEGDEAATRELLERRLGPDPVDEILALLARLD